MADAVLEKIKTDLLSCYICSGELTNPVGLPCLHGFCYECLYTWHQASQDKTQVICPACKKTVDVPEEGIQGFPAHSLAKDLKETVYMEQVSCFPNLQMKYTTYHTLLVNVLIVMFKYC